MWHNDGSSVSTLEKKTPKIYHVLKDINYGILRIYVEFWEKIRKTILVGCQKNLVHQMIPYIARLRHLENHTETVDLYLMHWHLNRLNVDWMSLVSLSLIPWMRLIRRIVTCDEKWVYYCNPDAAKRSPSTCQNHR